MSTLADIARQLQQPLFDFHYSVLTLINVTQPTTKNFLTIITTPIAYPTTLALFVVGKSISLCAGNSTAYLDGQEIKKKIDRLAASALPGWQEEAVKAIRQSRYQGQYQGQYPRSMERT